MHEFSYPKSINPQSYLTLYLIQNQISSFTYEIQDKEEHKNITSTTQTSTIKTSITSTYRLSITSTHDTTITHITNKTLQYELNEHFTIMSLTYIFVLFANPFSFMLHHCFTSSRYQVCSRIRRGSIPDKMDSISWA